jgi:cytochrome c-type biogenesis protein CcmH
MLELTTPLAARGRAPSGRRHQRPGEAGAAVFAWYWRLLLPAWLALCCAAASAQEARPMAEDPVLEARVMRIAEELRCLVCQNETIAASHADLAVDLRKQIRLQLNQGRSEQQILDFMVQRYGDFVLYRPPVKSSTWLLWGGPFILLGAALVALVLNIRRRRASTAAPLRADEAERVRRLLAEENTPT